MGNRSSTHDTDLRRIASRLMSQSALDPQVKGLVAFTDDEYHKTYSVYSVTAKSGGKYVLKQAREEPELHTYRDILQLSDPTPALLAYENVGQGVCWLLLEYVGQSDIRDADLSSHVAAAKALAELHAHRWGIDAFSYPFLRNPHEHIRSLRRFAATYNSKPGDPDLQRTISLQAEITKRLSVTPLTVVHGDLLSMNILQDDHGVARIIDWGSTMIASYALDLGRWLGDLRNDTAVGWVTESWVEPVLRAYYERQCQLLGHTWTTWHRMLDDVTCGRCFNYLGIVLSHLKHDWSRDGWYQANLATLRATTATLPHFRDYSRLE